MTLYKLGLYKWYKLEKKNPIILEQIVFVFVKGYVQ